MTTKPTDGFTSMHPMDCTDIKVLMSGLIDDEVDADTRHKAERHLAGCAPCRALLDEVERLNQSFTAQADADAAEELPEGFSRAVLQRTVYSDAPARSGMGWVNWLGWLAAAASLLLAVSIWVMDRPFMPASPPVALHAPETTGERDQDASTSGVTSVNRRSWTYEGNVPPEAYYLYASPGGDGVSGAASGDSPTLVANGIRRDDADVIAAAARLMQLLQIADPHDAEDVAWIRGAASYDNLVELMADTRGRLDRTDRAASFATESVLRRIIAGSLTPDTVQKLRDEVEQMGLVKTLQAISGHDDGVDTL